MLLPVLQPAPLTPSDGERFLPTKVCALNPGTVAADVRRLKLWSRDFRWSLLTSAPGSWGASTSNIGRASGHELPSATFCCICNKRLSVHGRGTKERRSPDRPVPKRVPHRADREIGAPVSGEGGRKISRIEPLKRGSRRESALTSPRLRMERTHVHCYDVYGKLRPRRFIHRSLSRRKVGRGSANDLAATRFKPLPTVCGSKHFRPRWCPPQDVTSTECGRRRRSVGAREVGKWADDRLA
jgi:hypothetical protein